MASVIKIKRNTADTQAPTTADIAVGEIAFVEATQKLYYRDSADNIRDIGGQGSFLRSDVNDTMDGDLTITGNLVVEGTTTTVESSTVSISDVNIKVASDNNNDGDNAVTSDTADFGLYGTFNADPAGTNATQYAGFFRDASDGGRIKFYGGLSTEPTTTVNTGDTDFALATLVAGTFEGDLGGTPTISNATVSGSFDMNGNELVLDADGDTSITADTDDQIDVKVGNVDRLQVTTSMLAPSANGGMALGSASNKFSNIYASGTVDLGSTVTISGGNIDGTAVGASTASTGAFTSISASSQITSTVTTGTAPFSIASNTVVSNLNADLLDGKHAPAGDIIGTTDTQTLTNKTLTSPVLTTPQINDASSDHQYIFAASELTADRTVTLPLLTGSDVFVFESHAQTLDNKTIDGGTF